MSRLNRAKLQASSEESIAADLLINQLVVEYDKNYLVNELLRFALSKGTEFQAD